MQPQFSRMALLVGEEAVERLHAARVAVFGVGGVGSFVVEALARSGVGGFLLVDHDVVDLTNINRQLHATLDTVGQYKTKLMRDRVLSINRVAKIETRETFCLPENVEELLSEKYDYIVDAVDTVSAKLAIIERAAALQIPVISAMGAGNKLDPAGFEVADIYSTSMCPLCRVMRRELKKRRIPALNVVYSKETPCEVEAIAAGKRRAVPGSIAFVPSAAGLVLAGKVVKDLMAHLPVNG